jgi:hypothetical protein
MNRPLLFSGLGLGLGFLLFACSGATRGVGENLGAADDELSKAKAACVNKACGESCTLCAAGDPNCVETAVLKQCNEQGRCSAKAAQCGGTLDPMDAGPAPDAVSPTDPIDAGPAPYEPCGGKGCGDTCSVCPPWDSNCVETGVVKFCHAGGDCLPYAPACIPPPPYQPCAGKACGDQCTVCDPTDPNCVETAVLKQCDMAGACVANVVVCQ